MRRGRGIIALILSVMLVFTSQLQVGMAYENESKENDQSAFNEDTVAQEHDRAGYFKAYEDDDDQQGEDDEGSGDEPDDAKEVYELDGTVYIYGFSESKTSGDPVSGKTVSITLENRNVTVTTDDDGHFSYVLDEEERTEDGEYEYRISGTALHYPAEGTISEGTEEEPEENKLYIRERYEASSSDYKFTESDDVKTVKGSTWLRSEGKYTIEPAHGKLLAGSLDGEELESLEVNVGSDGTIEDFYVYTGDYCSKVLTGEKTNIDGGAPEITSVTTEAAASGTFVKVHGIYGRTRADIVVNATITEDTDIEEAYLISDADGEQVRYDATKAAGRDGVFNVSIGLPGEETIMDAKLVKLVVVDVFGNTSTETLIAESEEGSEVTLEQLLPVISTSVEGKKSSYGWYKELPTIKASASDNLSGLSYLEIKGSGVTVASNTYSKKTTDEESISGKAGFSSESESGSYTYTARAVDNSGNEAKEEINLKIDLTAPSVSAYGVEDGAFYSAAPAVYISETEKYFSAEGNRIFLTVKKDGKTVLERTVQQTNSAIIDAGTFSEDGNYDVSIYAKDAAENESNTLTYSFIKDAAAPDIDITHNGSINENGWLNKIPTVTGTARDELSGLTSLSIYQDNKVKTAESYNRSTGWESVSISADLSSYGKDGAYLFRAEAQDRSGNKSAAEMSLFIDTVAPVISAEGVKNGEIYHTVPVIKVTEDEMYYDASGARIYYELTRGKEAVTKRYVSGKNTLSVPSSVYKKDGTYTVTIYAVDAAGNRSNTLKYKFIRDTKAPVVAISGVSEGKYYNKAQTVSIRVAEKNYKSNRVVISAVRTLGGKRTKVNFPWKNKALSSTSSKSFSDTGTYTITAYAVDHAGNRSKTKKISFTVDTKAPEITITGVKDGGVYTYGQGVAPKVEISDDYLASKSITYTKGGQSISSPSFSQEKENDGIWVLTATATDKSGNTTKKQVNFTLNRFGSLFEYNDSIKSLIGKAVKSTDSDLVITEKNVSKLEDTELNIYRDGKLIDGNTETSADEDSAVKVYRHIFKSSNFSDEGSYEIDVLSKDEAGNEMESKVENGPVRFFVDRTPPTLSLSGIDPKGNQAESINVTIRVKDLLTGVSEVHAYIDDEEVMTKETADGELFFTVSKGLRQELRVTAIDGAGNESEIKDMASVSTSRISLFMNRFRFIAGILAFAILGLCIFLILVKRKRKKEEEEQLEQEDV